VCAANNPECAENDERGGESEKGSGDKKGGFDSGENADHKGVRLRLTATDEGECTLVQRRVQGECAYFLRVPGLSLSKWFDARRLRREIIFGCVPGQS
jgi:hypothetical protein